MVLSGAVHEYDGFREPDRLAQLMADAAMRRGVPTHLSGAAASGCAGVAVSHSLGRLTWRQYASSSGMGGYPVVQNPWAEGDAWVNRRVKTSEEFSQQKELINNGNECVANE